MRKNASERALIGVIYARYSSHKQKDTSIEQQVEACQERAEELGITIIDIYADRAVTGKTDKRLNFQRMMNDAKTEKFDYVIAWKSDRMGRNMLEAMKNEETLMNSSVSVVYVKEDFGDNAAGRFAKRSMMNVNQFYIENMAENVKRSMDDNAKQCKANGPLPFGYKSDKNLNCVLDEPKDKIVKEIFTRVARGDAFVDIYNDLNARGVRNSIGREWNKSSFSRLLQNERYRGIYIFDNTRIEGGMPRIISDELFFKVQEALKMKKGAQGRHRIYGDYLLTGKLYCGKCQHPMIGMSGKSKTGESHYYYVCQKKRTDHSCDKDNVRRDDIEKAVAKVIMDYALQDDIIEWIADETVAYFKKKAEAPTISLLEDQLTDVNRSIKNIMNAIEKGIITDTTKARLLELEAEQRELNEKITLEKSDILPVNRENLIASLTALRDGDINNPKFCAELFNTFLVAVYLFDNDFDIVFGFPNGAKKINVPLLSDEIKNAEKSGTETCSYKLSTGSPFCNEICCFKILAIVAGIFLF